MRPVCPSLSDTMQCAFVTASDSDPTLDQSFLLEVMFGSGVQDRKHSPNCSSRVQAVGHHFPSHCLIIPSLRHFILSFIVPDKEQLHDVCPPRVVSDTLGTK